MAVTSLLLGSGIPGIIDAPVQFDPNNPHNQHAQDVYNHAAIQVPSWCSGKQHGMVEIGTPGACAAASLVCVAACALCWATYLVVMQGLGPCASRDVFNAPLAEGQQRRVLL